MVNQLLSRFHKHFNAESNALGRLYHGQSVAVVDIGSNSVRLVVYEALTRAPTPLFNEKMSCGLGRDVLETGLLNKDAMNSAYDALKRFKALIDVMQVSKVFAIATAASRDAKNGGDFILKASLILGQQVRVLSGEEEAHYAALGVISGVYAPNGLVGDMGGGSLELVAVDGEKIGKGITLPLGGLALQDRAHNNFNEAVEIVKSTFKKNNLIKTAEGKSFYAVGGTYRSLAKLMMFDQNYPLHVIQNYTIDAKVAIEFCKKVMKQPISAFKNAEEISDSRSSLLPYGALVMAELLTTGKMKDVVISALGVREGLLYEALSEEERALDPLLAASLEFCMLRSRSPQHAYELITWSDECFASLNLDETVEEKRLRHAACLLADVGWRAHPDYRGDQSLSLIANANFVGVTHAERAYLSLSIYFRHNGLGEHSLSSIITPRLLERARLLGGLMRVAYLVSASMPNTLPQTSLTKAGKTITLTLPAKLAMLASEKLQGRVKSFSKLVKLEGEIKV